MSLPLELNPALKQLLFYFIIMSFLFTGNVACKSTASISLPSTINGLHLLGEYEVPWQQPFRETTIGGLSGIDYDAARNVYYLISDDRSAINSARYYTAQIKISEHGPDSVVFLSVTTLRQPGGQPYPPLTKRTGTTPDPEAIRYNSNQKQWVWSSEGERIVKAGDTMLIDPAIYITNRGGNCIDSLLLPASLHMQAIEKGPRQNSTLEGLTFTDNYNTLFASVEESLYEDGPRASAEKGGLIRILRFNMHTRKSVAQYAYPIDPIAYPPDSSRVFASNGVAEIRAVNDHQLLAIERSYTAGTGFTIKLFLAELENAQDISTISSLGGNNQVRPLSKKLLLNMSSLNRYVDNVEGVTFGPLLPNGHRTLILVTDNNFNREEKTQFFVFEVL